MKTKDNEEIMKVRLIRIGATLIRCQIADRHIKCCLIYIFPRERGEDITLQLLSRLENSHSRQTLGELLKNLRNTMSVYINFDEILKRFLKNRNIIAHNLLDMPILNVEIECDVNHFLNQLYSDATIVGDVFFNFAARWSQQLGDEFLANNMRLLSEEKLEPYLDLLIHVPDK